MSTVQTVPAVGRLGVTAAALVEALRKGQPGDTYTDEQLQEICGKATGAGEPGYNALHSAINHVRTSHGLIWQRLRGAGAIRCLTADETVGTVTSDLRSIGRRARRTASKLQTVRIAEITDPTTRTRATVLGAALGAIKLMGSTDTVKKLDVRVNQVKTPSAADVLALFTTETPAPRRSSKPAAAAPTPPTTTPQAAPQAPNL